MFAALHSLCALCIFFFIIILHARTKYVSCYHWTFPCCRCRINCCHGILQNRDFLHVEAIGFGCPALFSPDLALSTKGYSTTMMHDADLLPRMSSASILNLLFNLIEYDWTMDAIEDFNFPYSKVGTTIVSWVRDCRTFTTLTTAVTIMMISLMMIPAM